MMLRLITTLLMIVALHMGMAPQSFAQEANGAAAASKSTQTLESILARQKGLQLATPSTVGPDEGTKGAGLRNQLGVLGAASDADVYRAYRSGSAEIISNVQSPAGIIVMQDGGMRWLDIRRGVLPTYGGYLLLAALFLVLVLYLIVGKIRIEGEKTGVMIDRFTLMERIGHWMMAIPFLLLGLTGLTLLFGRVALIPLFGKETYSLIATGGKFVHNYIAWIFMAGLVISFLRWALQNFPTRADVVWLLKAGGMFSKGSHPPAGKFNAGEKLVFWAVVGFGSLISLTGLALLFPYQIQVFSTLIQFLNDMGIPQFLGFGELNAALASQEEMQLANILHSSFSFLLLAIICFHIYLGTVGMEGALDAMTKGKVEEQWAKEHHSLWYDDVKTKQAEQ